MKSLLSPRDAADLRDLVLITLYELAEHFLSDHPHLNTDAAKTTLAAEIQNAIELEIQFMEHALEKAQ